MDKDLGRSGADAPSLSHPFGAEPVPVSGEADIANAGDFERWGLLTRNPAPHAAGTIGAATVEMVIQHDGRVRLAAHGHGSPACRATVTDSGHAR